MKTRSTLIGTTTALLLAGGLFSVPAQADHGDLPNGEPVSTYTGVLPDGSAVPADCVLPDGTADASCAVWLAHKLEHCMEKVDTLRTTSKAPVVVNDDSAALDQSVALAEAERRASTAEEQAASVRGENVVLRNRVAKLRAKIARLRG